MGPLSTAYIQGTLRDPSPRGIQALRYPHWHCLWSRRPVCLLFLESVLGIWWADGTHYSGGTDKTMHILCEHDPTKWSQNLPWIKHVLNSLPSRATGLWPFQIVYSFQPLCSPSRKYALAAADVRLPVQVAPMMVYPYLTWVICTRPIVHLFSNVALECVCTWELERRV